MKVGVVSGNVVSTINFPFFDSKKLMICDLITADGSISGYTIAVDRVGAGVGEVVLIMDEGFHAAWANTAALGAPDVWPRHRAYSGGHRWNC